MNIEREYNYDLLRTISMIAVIMIHVSATWVNGFLEYMVEGGMIEDLLHPMMSCIYNTISRFAVPCFVMLTGAFVLADNSTENYKVFYKKKIIKIGIPTMVFSIVYILYRLLFCFVGERVEFGDIILLAGDVVKGSPFYHMWYLYMLIELYLLAPIVVRFKNSITYEDFRKTAFVFLIFASISNWTTENTRLNWDIGQAFEYLGYFMVGYVLRRDLITKRNNYKGLFMIIIGALLLMVTAFIKYQFQMVNGIAESELKYKIVSPYCPIIVVSSLLIFSGFTMLKVGENIIINKLANMSFFIYLIHAGVWDFLRKLIDYIKDDYDLIILNNIFWIPFFVIISLLISIFLTNVYNKVELFLLSKNRR